MTTRTRLPGTPQPMHRWPGRDGLAIAGDTWGTPGRQALILLHGGGQTRHAWRGSGESLAAAGYHTIAFDARGHGDSDWAPDGDYGTDAMVRDLQTVIAANGAKRPVLIGASMGGNTSLMAIGEGHVDAKAIILVDIVPRPEADGVARIREFMSQKPEGFVSLEEVAQAISAYQPQRTKPRNLDGLAKNVRLGADGRYYWHWDPKFRAATDPTVVRKTDRALASARALTLPALLVRGAMSDVVSDASVKEFLELCPHAEFIDVAGAGHMVAGDKNDAFGRSAADFLQRVAPPGF